MQFYHLTGGDPDDGDVDTWFATRDAAHQTAKEVRVPYQSIRIDLHDIELNKDNILALLIKTFKVERAGPPLRTWNLTQRGGLLEIEPGQ